MAPNRLFREAWLIRSHPRQGAHIEVEGTLRSRERTIELKGSTEKELKTLTYRSWTIRAESIRKLDRAERANETDPHSDDDTVE